VRTIERALALRWRCCSDWRARFFADLMLAKGLLRYSGLEKDFELCGLPASASIAAAA